jgi:hypothetical protein
VARNFANCAAFGTRLAALIHPLATRQCPLPTRQETSRQGHGRWLRDDESSDVDDHDGWHKAQASPLSVLPRQFLFAGPESIDSSARSPKQHDGGAQSKAVQHEWQAVWPYHHRFSHADSFDPSCAGSLLSSPLDSAIHRPRLRFSVFSPLPQGHSSMSENVQESGLSAAVRWQVSSTNSVDRRHGGGASPGVSISSCAYSVRFLSRTVPSTAY